MVTIPNTVKLRNKLLTLCFTEWAMENVHNLMQALVEHSRFNKKRPSLLHLKNRIGMMRADKSLKETLTHWFIKNPVKNESHPSLSPITPPYTIFSHSLDRYNSVRACVFFRKVVVKHGTSKKGKPLQRLCKVQYRGLEQKTNSRALRSIRVRIIKKSTIYHLSPFWVFQLLHLIVPFPLSPI